jgi:hypothetical protein|tara:strand:- start:4134 stop:4523 length:390 start_codon:yes stop_codon:yes gene_type:complete
MNLDIDTASKEWLEAKEIERKAVDRRRKLEDHISSLVGIPDNLDGTSTTDTDGGHKIKIVGRMNHKIDKQKIRELAEEHGLNDYLESLFRWKAEINMKAWVSSDPSITNKLLDGITTVPSRSSFTITAE